MGELRSFLERRLLAAVMVAGAVGVALPGPGRWVIGADGIDVLLAVLVFASALSVPEAAAASLRRHGARLVVIVAVTTTALPVLTWALSRLVSGDDLRHGVLSVGVAPAEVASVGITGIAGGDVAVAATLLVASMVASVAVAGPVLSLLTGISVSSGHVLGTLVLVVVLPLMAGLVLGHLVTLSPTQREATGLVAVGAVIALVELVAGEAHRSTGYVGAGAVLVGVIAASAVLGWALGHLVERRAALAVLLHVSMRDFAVAGGIASAAFGPASTAPLGIYGVLVIGWGAVVARSVAARR